MILVSLPFSTLCILPSLIHPATMIFKVLLVLLILLCSSTSTKPDSTTKSYIVYHDDQFRSNEFVLSNSLTPGSGFLYVFQCLGGFATKLSREQAEELRHQPGVLAVVEDSLRYQVQTTRSPEFLGLRSAQGIWPQTHFGYDAIIGMIDTGIWPESPSFADGTLGPVPSRWKGSCQFTDSPCNRKIIGAKVFSSGYQHLAADDSTRGLQFCGDYDSPEMQRDTGRTLRPLLPERQ